MEVTIDYDVCASTGQCAVVAPDVFRIEDGVTRFDAHPAESQRDAVEDAVDSCPLQAIRIVG